MSQRVLIRLTGPWAILIGFSLASSALALDAPPRTSAVELPELNARVVAFARAQVGKQVGNGECTELVAEALDAAGARRFGYDPSGDYVWGSLVPSFREALPGDLVQFRDVIFEGRRSLPGNRILTYHYDYPHHSAVVAAVRDNGAEVVLLHQNIVPLDGDPADKKRVQQGSIRPATLRTGGRIWIFRPVARDRELAPERHTRVSIVGDAFHINGRPTYEGRVWEGHSIEGLLLNSRTVQATFDDLNPQTRKLWVYPDTHEWDPDRNTREFLEALPGWRKSGLLAVTLNLQGGSPQGYSKGKQPWHNSAITPTGELRSEYLRRFEKILDRTDELGMVVILGVFYFGQDERLRDEAAVVGALDRTVDWILERGYQHVLLEVNNECNVRYDHPILRPDRVAELIARARGRSRERRRLLVGTSYGGGTVPGTAVARVSDFLLMHGNGVSNPDRIAEMVRQARALPDYRPMPILFNEDDHFDFDRPRNNFVAAISEHASWGYFDPGKSNYRDGYQSPPVDWKSNSEIKRSFFAKLAEITGAGKPGD